MKCPLPAWGWTVALNSNPVSSFLQKTPSWRVNDGNLTSGPLFPLKELQALLRPDLACGLPRYRSGTEAHSVYSTSEEHRG
jgi:hypothetical protein